jgi:predicted Zn-dependent peptidase
VNAVEPPVPTPRPTPTIQLPAELHTLDNGLRVVLSPDHSAPIATVAVYYGIGFRIEPRDRTGFAHLFEHMMFQGSGNLGKMEFLRLINSRGGDLNGSTRFDFTNYYEIFPSNALEAVLWAEADRMRSLDVSDENLRNQQAVVSNEVRVNVLNRPYGGFPWLSMPQLANQNWYNAHNFYGDLADIEAAKLDEVQAFFRTYYVPSNAVLTVVGDFDPATTMAWIEKYYGDLPKAPRPSLPDITEPPQTAERRKSYVDPLAERPALAVGWHMPDRGSPEFWAMAWIAQVLAAGDDSWLSASLVRQHAYTGTVQWDINTLGNQFNYRGPMLFEVYCYHDSTTAPDSIIEAIDTEIAKLAAAPLDAATFERARGKVRSAFYNLIDESSSRADLLATATLFDGDPASVNRMESHLMAVTPAQIQATAKAILRKDNRSVLIVQPGKEAK